MAMHIKTPANTTTAQAAPRASDWTHRSLAASSQQKVFQNVLNQVQPSVDSGNAQEPSSFSRDLNALRDMETRSQNIDSLRARATSQPLNGAEANTLAATALISLTALMPSRGDSLNGYIEALGTGAMAKNRFRGAAQTARPAPAPPETQPKQESKGLGGLSARFESGDAGIDVIGYDETGGTSYGTYQISSRTGTMRRFVGYLEDNAPEWARRLKAAGPLDSGGRTGAVPREWQKIAAEDPRRFGKLQHDFIYETHYAPALEEIQERTGIDVNKQSQALQEVLWSTAVQHGPKGAANIFCKAIEKNTDSKSGNSKAEDISGQDLIHSVYASRSRQFGSSTNSVRNSVLRRFQEEKMLALTMLNQEGRNLSATA